MGVNDTLLETLDRTVTEDFGKSIMAASHDEDPWSSNLINSSMGVSRDGLGRGWQKFQVFKQGLGGAARWRPVTGNSITTSQDDNQFAIYGTAAPQTFPDLDEQTAPTYVQANITLKEMAGSFPVPTELLRLDQNPNNIANQVGAIIEASARRVARREILAFWGESATNSGTVGAYAKVNNSGNVTIKADGVVSGSTAITEAMGLTRYMCLRFQPGESLDVYRNNSGTYTQKNTAASQPVFVAFVDPVAIEIKLIAYSGSDITLTGGENHELWPRESSTLAAGAVTNHQPTALEQVIVNSGTVYGLSLTNFPFFKSVVAAVNGSLTENVLNKFVGGFLVVKPASGKIDSLVTTPGVKNEYVNNLTYSGRRDRFSMPVSLGGEGFTSDWGYQWDGTKMAMDTSSFCPEGTLFGLKLANGNWKKIVPPGIPGTGSDGRFGDGVEFLGSMTHNSIFVPAREPTSAAYTDFLEAPFKRWLEYMPEYICGMKLTGLTEHIATS